MLTIMECHQQAMELADEADKARRTGCFEKANSLLREAYEFEKKAASKLESRYNIEPTRSVFFRSAASLAMECGLTRDAERMIALGLSGSPPDEIAEELRDLLEKVNFERHLSLRGVELSTDEFQVALSGRGVGSGIVEVREFKERIDIIETLSVRTFERKRKKPFRTSGPPAKDIAENISFFMSVPRAASFAVTIRVGKAQSELPELSDAGQVVTELIDCLELAAKGEGKLLQERIPEEAYLQNFRHLVKQISPDGQIVQAVGFTAILGGRQRSVVLDKPRKTITETLSEPGEDTLEVSRTVNISGNLRYADSTKKKQGLIEIVETNGSTHKIRVPLSMMADIVRPMFEYDVIVRAQRTRGNRLVLEDIEKLNA